MIHQNKKELVDRIRDTHLVLDVGGWHAPLNRANYVIDIMPYETRNRNGALLVDRWPDEHFTESTYVQKDLCDGESWPFSDKQFDFVFCVHTLEDLRDPIQVCRELVRVAKAGYIEVPSRFVESTRGVERPFYCGYYHHRWLCETSETKISFQFKPAMLHAYRQFYFSKPWYKKVNPDHASVGFFWRGSFDFEEKIIIDRGEVQESLSAFKMRYAKHSDLFVPKYHWWGGRA